MQDELAVTTMTTTITGTGELGTNASGVMSGGQYTSDVTTTSEWTSWADTYQEYRVLGIRFQWVPLRTAAYNNTSQLPPTGAIATRHNPGVTAPTALATLVNTSTFKLWNAGNPMEISWRMKGIDEASFQSTSSATSLGGIVYYLQGGTTSANFGRFVVTWVVQFKGRQ